MMHRKRVVLVALAGLSSCFGYDKNPEACQDGVCIDPERPYCDKDGSVDGHENTCIALSCTPGEFVACSRAGGALTCTSTGDDTTETACAIGCDPGGGCVAQGCVGDTLVTQMPNAAPSMTSCVAGCVATPSPHCLHIVPRYVPDVCETAASNADLVISSSGTLDTSLDANCNGGLVTQTGAPELCVVHHRSIKVESGVALQVVGARPIAFVADRDVILDGLLDVAARPTELISQVEVHNGPGGGVTSSGGPPSAPNNTAGGGAGFRTVGGNAGNATTDGGANNAGVQAADPATLAVLIGGPSAANPVGGGGGGAATLVACGGAVTVNGTIDAGGGGGLGGFVFLGASLGGGGGGAGGYVVLQGLSVRVIGGVFANGGGGGGGRVPGLTSGKAGQSGSTFCALGGTTNNGEGAGGNGGCATTTATPTVGKHPVAAGTTPGGGGGSLGFFQSYTPTLDAAVLTPSSASPPFQTPALIPTR